MKTSLLRFTVASGILCLLPVSIQAQQGLPGQATEQQQGQASPQSAQAQQRGQQPQRGETQQRGQQQRRQAQSQRLESFLVSKLMVTNQAKIELSQMASEMVQNEEVKEFAKKLAKDHQKLHEELMQLSSEDVDRRRPGQARPGQADQNRADETQPGQARRPQQRADSPAKNRAGQPAMRGQGPLPQQLMRIFEQTSELKLLMIKDLLGEVGEGKGLDMAFVGIEILEHTEMLAELDAMKDVGSEDFQQLVGKAHESTREHLEKAKELAKKLKEDDPSRSGHSRRGNESN